MARAVGPANTQPGSLNDHSVADASMWPVNQPDAPIADLSPWSATPPAVTLIFPSTNIAIDTGYRLRSLPLLQTWQSAMNGLAKAVVHAEQGAWRSPASQATHQAYRLFASRPAQFRGQKRAAVRPWTIRCFSKRICRAEAAISYPQSVRRQVAEILCE